jgi:GntR family transcriptional regulator
MAAGSKAMAKLKHDGNPQRVGYREISAAVEDWIRHGKYGPGDQIPKETDLAASFGVSRLTVRRALSSLVEAGVLSPIPSRGTFVSKDAVLAPVTAPLSHATRQLFEMVKAAKGQFLGSSPVKADALECSLFGLKAGETVTEYQFLRLWKDQPLGFGVIHLPMRIADQLPKPRAGTQYELTRELRKRGIEPRRVRQSIGAQIADHRMSKLLDIAVGMPVLKFTHVFYAEGNRVFQRATGYYRSDRFEYDIEFLDVR